MRGEVCIGIGSVLSLVEASPTSRVPGGGLTLPNPGLHLCCCSFSCMYVVKRMLTLRPHI